METASPFVHMIASKLSMDGISTENVWHHLHYLNMTNMSDEHRFAFLLTNGEEKTSKKHEPSLS